MSIKVLEDKVEAVKGNKPSVSKNICIYKKEVEKKKTGKKVEHSGGRSSRMREQSNG